MEHLPAYATEYLPDHYQDGARAEIKRQLALLADGVEDATLCVVEGHSGRTILDWVNEHPVDLIVVASHRPGMQDLFLGSTAARIVRHTPCAVHVLR